MWRTREARHQAFKLLCCMTTFGNIKSRSQENIMSMCSVLCQCGRWKHFMICNNIQLFACACVTIHACCLTFAEMNRHHYSLYVHNCRLVFLLRRDFTQFDTFRPAEFHWKLEQVRRVYAEDVCACLSVCVGLSLAHLSGSIDWRWFSTAGEGLLKEGAFQSNYQRRFITFLCSGAGDKKVADTLILRAHTNTHRPKVESLFSYG